MLSSDSVAAYIHCESNRNRPRIPYNTALMDLFFTVRCPKISWSKQNTSLSCLCNSPILGVDVNASYIDTAVVLIMDVISAFIHVVLSLMDHRWRVYILCRLLSKISFIHLSSVHQYQPRKQPVYGIGVRVRTFLDE